jgi:hypothetical protein
MSPRRGQAHRQVNVRAWSLGHDIYDTDDTSTLGLLSSGILVRGKPGDLFASSAKAMKYVFQGAAFAESAQCRQPFASGQLALDGEAYRLGITACLQLLSQTTDYGLFDDQVNSLESPLSHMQLLCVFCIGMLTTL